VEHTISAKFEEHQREKSAFQATLSATVGKMMDMHAHEAEDRACSASTNVLASGIKPDAELFGHLQILLLQNPESVLEYAVNLLRVGITPRDSYHIKEVSGSDSAYTSGAM